MDVIHMALDACALVFTPLSLILQGVSLPEKQRTSNCRPAKRRADDADFTRYNDGMNPKQMGDFISQTNNAL